MSNSKKEAALNAAKNSIIVNILLSIFKLIAGIFAHSSVMISDAVHSFSDVFSSFIVVLGIKISAKESDDDHQYGHERLENVAAIILSGALFVTGIFIGLSGISKVVSATSSNLSIPGALALVAAGISIVVKEWMYWYTKSAAKSANSDALMADAWHHRSDALSSLGSLVAIFGARLGFPILDPLASIVICGFILKVAIDIFLSAISKMTDRACDAETVKQIEEIILSQDGVLGIDLLRTRIFGDKIFVDVEILANGNDTLYETHAIAQKVHDATEAGISNVKHCMVHVNPFEKEISKISN